MGSKYSEYVSPLSSALRNSIQLPVFTFKILNKSHAQKHREAHSSDAKSIAIGLAIWCSGVAIDIPSGGEGNLGGSNVMSAMEVSLHHNTT